VNKVVIPSMKARNYGRIVNISSVAGKEGNPNLSAYSAAKAGVLGLVKSMGKELAKYDIAVNAITPAVANTRINQNLDKEFIQYMLSRIPRGRFLEVDELANMVAWLVSKENSFTTASVFDLSGGRTTY
jgi:NAD(P)-dependent dehydrogenase (short-subunit alcohol dehydrogenase family)